MSNSAVWLEASLSKAVISRLSGRVAMLGSGEDDPMLKSVLHNRCVRVQVQRIH